MSKPTDEPIHPQWEHVLETVREADAHAGASPDLELRLRGAFRSHHGGPSYTRRGYRRWMAGAIAASLAAVGFWQMTPERTITERTITERAMTERAMTERAMTERAMTERRMTSTPPAPTAAQFSSPAPEVAEPRVARSKQARRISVKAEAAPDVTTGFIELPFAPAMSPYDGGQVIRVRLPRSSMRAVGLPVNEDRLWERVQADVLTGNDGIARAVRFLP